MGKVLYDMGFMSFAEVIECSAFVLIVQYVGLQLYRYLPKCFYLALMNIERINECYLPVHPSCSAQFHNAIRRAPSPSNNFMLAV